MRTPRRKVRRTQTISPFGVGGIIDLRGESFVAADIRSWAGHGAPVHAARLAAKLKVNGFRAAPVLPSGKAEYAATVGPVYVRFPAWLFCPNCRRMTRWSPSLEKRDTIPTCGRCSGNPTLAPMRFVQICRSGHLADVDWRRWAHATANRPEQRQCDAKSLKFEVSSASAGLDSLTIRCATCDAHQSLQGISTRNMLKRVGARCTGRQPWQGNEESIDCLEVPQVIQRGASNAYFPLIHSAIDIPAGTTASVDESDAQKVYGHAMWADLCSASNGPLEDAYTQIIATQCDVTQDTVKRLLKQHVDEVSGKPAAADEGDDITGGEWGAFTRPTDSQGTSGNFVIREVGLGVTHDDPLSLQRIDERITQVVVADRIREVRALEGFWRDEPVSRDRLISVNPVTKPAWLPAIESYGEGIFIAFDEQRLRAWEDDPAVADWTNRLDGDLSMSFFQERLRELTGPRLLPRYVMIHTFAHQLIRQLAYDSGYNAASLRERVYARSHHPSEDRPPQAGVLIYTASGDAEGTLGGLVRQGEPPNLAQTLVRLLESALWCSNDPLCADPTSRGLTNLNRAACHACSLLPETSCEGGNALLDRTVLIGDGRVSGFFRPVIEQALEEAAATIEGS